MSYGMIDLSAQQDLEQTGQAFLILKNALVKAERKLKRMYSETSKEELMLRGDLLDIMLVLREAVEAVE